MSNLLSVLSVSLILYISGSGTALTCPTINNKYGGGTYYYYKNDPKELYGI